MNYELLIAFLSVKEPKLGPGGGWNRPDDNWKVLFSFYNNNLPAGAHKLGMGCQSCFAKVYAYCKQVLLMSATASLVVEDATAKLKANEFRSQNIV